MGNLVLIAWKRLIGSVDCVIIPKPLLGFAIFYSDGGHSRSNSLQRIVSGQIRIAFFVPTIAVMLDTFT